MNSQIAIQQRYGSFGLPVVVLDGEFAVRYYNPRAIADRMIPLRPDIAALVTDVDLPEACRRAMHTQTAEVCGTIGRWWKERFVIRLEKFGDGVALMFRHTGTDQYSCHAVRHMTDGYEHLLGHELHNMLTTAETRCLKDPKDLQAQRIRRDALRGIRTARCMRALGTEAVCCPVEMTVLVEELFRPIADFIKLRYGKTVALEIPRGMGTVVKTDPEWFRMMFYCLIRDALEHRAEQDDPLVITVEQQEDGCAVILPDRNPEFHRLSTEQLLAGDLPPDVLGKESALNACRLLTYRLQGDMRSVRRADGGQAIACVMPYAYVDPVSRPYLRALLEENISSSEIEFSIMEE